MSQFSGEMYDQWGDLSKSAPTDVDLDAAMEERPAPKERRIMAGGCNNPGNHHFPGHHQYTPFTPNSVPTQAFPTHEWKMSQVWGQYRVFTRSNNVGAQWKHYKNVDAKSYGEAAETAFETYIHKGNDHKFFMIVGTNDIKYGSLQPKTEVKPVLDNG